MVKKSVNSTKRRQFSGTKALNSLVEVGIKVAAFVTVMWRRRATWNQRDGVNTTGAWMWLSTRNPADELRHLVEVWGVLCTLAAHSARCSCLFIRCFLWMELHISKCKSALSSNLIYQGINRIGKNQVCVPSFVIQLTVPCSWTGCD